MARIAPATWRRVLVALVIAVLASASPSAGSPTPGGWAAASTAAPATPVKAVEAGGLQTCAILEDGALRCWGDMLLVSNPPAGEFDSISMSSDSACAVRTDGTLVCWDVQGGGVAPAPGGTFRQVEVGPYHSCAIRSGGTVTCWGTDWYGETQAPDGEYTDLVTGDFWSCGLLVDGSVTCWGGNPEESPRPSLSGRFHALGGPEPLCGIHDDGSARCWDWEGEYDATGRYLDIDGRCALKVDRTLFCWGDEPDAGTNGLALVPAGSFDSVSTGFWHACALAGTAMTCWGNNYATQVVPAPTPTMIGPAPWRSTAMTTVEWAARPALSAVTSYDVRYRRAPATGGFGAWTTWLTGTTQTSAAFTTSPGYTYCFAVRAHDASGAVSPWTNQGWNLGETGCTTTPVDDRALVRSAGWDSVSDPALFRSTGLRTTRQGATLKLNDVRAGWVVLLATTCPTCGSLKVAVAGHGSRSLSLRSPITATRFLPAYYESVDGRVDVTVTVSSSSGQVQVDGLLVSPLELGPAWADASDPPQPGSTSVARGATDLSAGDSHTCAVTVDGRIACWGSDSDKQAEAPAGQFTSVAAGVALSCGVRDDGTAVCWGGDSASSWDDPVAAPPGTFKRLVLTSNDDLCGIRTDGSLWCAGDEDELPAGYFASLAGDVRAACAVREDGELLCWGTGPVADAAPKGVFTTVDVSMAHACAIAGDGHLECWGDNSVGQATAPHGTFKAVTTGSAHSCAIREDGTIACWGDAEYGELLVPSGAFTGISAGGRHTCAFTAEKVACWGQNRDGQATPTPTTTIGALAPYTVATTTSVSWSASGLAPIASHDVRYRVAPWNGSFGDRVAWRTATTATTAARNLPTGSTICYSARARDVDGVVSRWSGERCVHTPVDDRALARSTGWTKITGTAFYRGTALRSSRHGATLSIGGVRQWSGLYLVATTCPTCGVVRVTWGHYGSRRINLYSAKRVDRKVIRVTPFDDDYPPTRAKVNVTVVSSGKKVVIDGILIKAAWDDLAW